MVGLISASTNFRSVAKANGDARNVAVAAHCSAAFVSAIIQLVCLSLCLLCERYGLADLSAIPQWFSYMLLV